jgi:hypothetical protein
LKGELIVDERIRQDGRIIDGTKRQREARGFGRLTLCRSTTYIARCTCLACAVNSFPDDDMNDPTITCPQCRTEIKLTESLAAPLLESTRQQYEKRLLQSEAEIAKREAEIKDREAAVVKAKEAIGDQVAEKLKTERVKIAAEEA